MQISYWINPVQPWLPEEQVVAAIRAAFATWQAAVPTVRFDYRGTTPLPPVSGDGFNVVGWGPYLPGAATFTRDDGVRIYEMDTFLTLPYPAWQWYPCEQRNDSCTPLSRQFLSEWSLTKNVWPYPGFPSLVVIDDVQNDMTHEAGHWLWLGDLYDEDTVHMTMYGFVGEDIRVERKKVTLGLGDVLGARSLYPCGCPLPPIYAP